jgi:pimeloyl-ACP methyl ester carboxylesterase
MAGVTRRDLADARGAGRLLFAASTGIVDLVEQMHRTVQRAPGPLGAPVSESTRGITGIVYRAVRGSIGLIGRGLDLSLAPIAALLPEGAATPDREVLVSVVNGVYGDYLAQTGNPLALDMELRHDGVTVDPGHPGLLFDGRSRPAPTGRVLVLVHGLCMSDQQWAHGQGGHGAALARDLGYTPLYVRYNSGLPIAANGVRFAELLEALLNHWPCDIERLTLVGHSMGGLVARSACLAAQETQLSWPSVLRDVVFLGTPHHGAPLERGGHGLDALLGLSPYSAPFKRIGGTRSSGIQDLRHGTITSGAHRHVPLPVAVDCYAIAATLAARRSVLADRLTGDGLVPLHSALGRHDDRGASLRFPQERQWVGYQMGHLELLRRPEVYTQMRAWLQASPPH